MNNNFQNLKDILNKKRENKKPPAYQWQDLALKIIKELDIPNFKKSSIFKVCKNYDKNFIEKCLDDTKELCERGDKWKYFFKIIKEENKK